MKTLRQLSAALVLTCVFTSAALPDDGIMHGDKTPPPPPPMASANVGDATSVETPSSDPAAADLATDMALSVLQRALGWL